MTGVVVLCITSPPLTRWDDVDNMTRLACLVEIVCRASFGRTVLPFTWWERGSWSFTLKKLECLRQAHAVNKLAWNNKIGLRHRWWVTFLTADAEFLRTRCCANGRDHGLSVSILLVFRAEVMIDRDSWGCWYCRARGEILGFWQDQLMRKHSPRMSSLIKNESWGIEDDQIPS